MAERTEVVFVDGVRTPFGRAGEKGQYWNTRADDLVVKAMIGLLERNPSLPKDQVEDVAIAATTQVGDQALTIGRSAAILAGLPETVPGYAIDRMCSGAMTAVTNVGSQIGFGAIDLAIAGGVEHMGRHRSTAPSSTRTPRFLTEGLVSADAMNMGITAENLHDRFPQLTKLRADEYAVQSQRKAAAAYAANKIQPDLIPVAIQSAEGWGLATTDELMRPGTTLEGVADLKTPFRPHGRVTAATSSPLTDGATASIIASADKAKELGLPAKMRLVSFGFAGVEPEVMGLGPVPSTEKALKKAGLTIDEIGLFELNEAFAVQVLSLLDHFGIADDDPRVNLWGGALAYGHPLASSGVRLMTQLAAQFAEHPRGPLRPHRDVRRSSARAAASSGRTPTTTGRSKWRRQRAPRRSTRASTSRARSTSAARTRSSRTRTSATSGSRAASASRWSRSTTAGTHTRPTTLGPITLLELTKTIEALAVRIAEKELDAVAITGKPYYLAAGADLSKIEVLSSREQALRSRSSATRPSRGSTSSTSRPSPSSTAPRSAAASRSR